MTSQIQCVGFLNRFPVKYLKERGMMALGNQATQTRIVRPGNDTMRYTIFRRTLCHPPHTLPYTQEH